MSRPHPRPRRGRLLPRILLALLALLALAYLLAALLPGRAAPNPYLPDARLGERPLVIAHQGAEHLWPSNTMVAFRGSAPISDVLETDMHATRDGAFVLIHDQTLDRTTDRSGAVRDLTLAEVRAADAGYRFSPPDSAQTQNQTPFPWRGRGVQVATLDELLEAFPEKPLVIEIKQEAPSIAAPFCERLRAAGATARVTVASFSDRALGEFRAACPEVMTSMTARELRPLVLLSKVGLSGLAPAPGQLAQVPVRAGGITVVTPGFVRAMERRGVAVQVWTINDPAEMRRLVDMGVHGIITDRPDLMQDILRGAER